VKAEVHGDELLVIIDVSELPYRATARSLAANLPGSASEIATEVVGMLDKPKAATGPVTVRAVTVKLVRTDVIAEQTLMLDTERQVFT
jgi:hypothetical protein